MKSFWRLITLLALAALVVIGTGLVTSPAEAQCAIRADWSVYRVVRGDTLSRIARRYGLTTLELMQANCLTATRIITGQSLRVPPLNAPSATPSVAVPPGMQPGTYLVNASYQSFENGFMLWWSNSGEIWVFYTNSATVRVYTLAAYGGLSIPRLLEPIPAGRLPPQDGFGRVWYNFPEVRTGLGWATASEQGYQLFVRSPAFGTAFFTITLPDSKTLKIVAGGNWTLDPGSPAATFTPGPTDPRIGATFQPFDNGFMLWRADSGEIWVFIGQEVGEISRYANSTYGGWSVRSYVAPPGRTNPQNGFGRVWSNVPEIQQTIGFALAGETGYLMTARIQGGNTVAFGLPDGRIVSQRSDGRWQLSSFAPPPTPFPTPPPPPITPAPTVPTLPPPSLTPNQTGATFQIFENGFLLWRADTGEISAFIGIGQAERLSYPLAAYSGLRIQPITPRPGSSLLPENGFGKVWSNNPGLRDRIGWPVTSEMGFIMTLRYDSAGQIASFNLPYEASVTRLSGENWSAVGLPDFRPTPWPTPLNVPSPTPPPVLTVQAAFQCYERGRMIWRADTGMIYVLIGKTGTVTRHAEADYAPLSIDPGPAPSGLIQPVSGFGKVWSGYQWVRDTLGYATKPEEGLTVLITDNGPSSRIGIPGGGAVDIGPSNWMYPSLGDTWSCA